MFRPPTRVFAAVILVLALASTVFVVDASTNPEPASAAWEWREVREVVYTTTCFVTTSLATAYAFAGTSGWVAVLGASTSEYALYEACKRVPREVIRRIRVLVKGVKEHGVTNNPYRGGNPSRLCIGGWCIG